MARTGGECHGDDVAVLPVDMAVEAFEACVEAEVRWVLGQAITRLNHVR